ncbi:MAG: OsmC family protein [Methanobacteriota archaeon]|nr:MAG: OsmC family protein [Euryarchaeota archaeon]
MHDRIHTHLRQVDGYRFEASFDEWDGSIILDEPSPLGSSEGPNAAMLLSSAVGHCPCASFMFCMSKADGKFGGLSADVETRLAKNDKGRWRIEGIKVDMKATLNDENGKKAERCRELYEDFCIVTGSVRQGVKVDVDLGMEFTE